MTDRPTNAPKTWLPMGVLFLALMAVNAWMTSRFFGCTDNLANITSDSPVVSGRHALHAYHGMLGAAAWSSQGTLFDPAYMAGYPKTPIFDAGSRPAELFCLADLAHPFAAYKRGFAIVCLLAPFFFFGMARGLELSPVGSMLTALLGTIVWWSRLNIGRLVEGELDVLLGSVFSFLHCCWLIRFAHRPGLGAWAMLTASAALAWHIQPVFFLIYLPAIGLHYLWNAGKHDLTWNLALFTAWGTAIGVNAPWLREWLHCLGMLLPVMDEPFSHRSFAGAWRGWREFVPQDPFIFALGIGGLVGLPVLAYRHRSASIILVLGSLSLGFASVAHRIWPMLEELHLSRLLFIVVWFAIFPLADALSALAARLERLKGGQYIAGVGIGFILGMLGIAIDLPRQWSDLPVVRVGVDARWEPLVLKLKDAPPASGRVLWEDLPEESESNWTALLAPLTGRAYLGGIDPDGRLEHSYARLVNGKLAGRPIEEWSDADLERFFVRYNVTQVVARVPKSAERFAKLANADAVRFPVIGLSLFSITRESKFFLKGKGRWVEADAKRVALADVEPEDGEIILSLHFQQGWNISPAVGTVERQLDADDPIPFIRIRIPGNLPRLTLEWRSP